MITRVEIDGYKSFQNFSLDLNNLTVIAGLNGVGKSNLFDALKLLSRLANLPLSEAFETERGSFIELFTQYADGSRSEYISFAIEMILPEVVKDDFSKKSKIKYNKIKYELIISLDENKLILEKENLFSKDKNIDLLSLDDNNIKELQKYKDVFIYTAEEYWEDPIIIVIEDKSKNDHVIFKEWTKRTILSGISNINTPHIYATRKLLSSIHFLQLNPEALRKPSRFLSNAVLTPEGDHLAAVLARLQKHNPDIITMISNQMAEIVPSVSRVFLDTDERRMEYTVYVEHTDGSTTPSTLLSDGTLRILALVTIKYDPEYTGIILLEEPENGVHATRLKNIFHLLESMTEQEEDLYPARQVLCSTHSVNVINLVRRSNKNPLVFAFPVRSVQNHKKLLRTHMVSLDPEKQGDIPQKIVQAELKKILASVDSEEE